MEKEEYLPLYFKWMKTGQIPTEGLCRYFEGEDPLFNLIDPENGSGETYWGCDKYGKGGDYRCATAKVFGPLRQNVILLMAAMNNEL